mmetsp:Transcript_89380/g.252867  ORF Transcript_89380/g.252867 Transcript_89380/m.252867 type:complete len:451 (+) Transcript_89380:1138-2490(+)
MNTCFMLSMVPFTVGTMACSSFLPCAFVRAASSDASATASSSPGAAAPDLARACISISERGSLATPAASAIILIVWSACFTSPITGLSSEPLRCAWKAALSEAKSQAPLSDSSVVWHGTKATPFSFGCSLKFFSLDSRPSSAPNTTFRCSRVSAGAYAGVPLPLLATPSASARTWSTSTSGSSSTFRPGRSSSTAETRHSEGATAQTSLRAASGKTSLRASSLLGCFGSDAGLASTTGAHGISFSLLRQAALEPSSLECCWFSRSKSNRDLSTLPSCTIVPASSTASSHVISFFIPQRPRTCHTVSAFSLPASISAPILARLSLTTRSASGLCAGSNESATVRTAPSSLGTHLTGTIFFAKSLTSASFHEPAHSRKARRSVASSCSGSLGAAGSTTSRNTSVHVFLDKAFRLCRRLTTCSGGSTTTQPASAQSSRRRALHACRAGDGVGK